MYRAIKSEFQFLLFLILWPQRCGRVYLNLIYMPFLTLQKEKLNHSILDGKEERGKRKGNTDSCHLRAPPAIINKKQKKRNNYDSECWWATLWHHSERATKTSPSVPVGITLPHTQSSRLFGSRLFGCKYDYSIKYCFVSNGRVKRGRNKMGMMEVV